MIKRGINKQYKKKHCILRPTQIVYYKWMSPNQTPFSELSFIPPTYSSLYECFL